MTLFRGYGGDLPLMRWLREKVWPVEAKLEAEDVYWGARLACVEMVRTGTAKIANCIKFSVQQVENLMQFVVVEQFELGGRRTSCCCAVTHTS